MVLRHPPFRHPNLYHIFYTNSELFVTANPYFLSRALSLATSFLRLSINASSSATLRLTLFFALLTIFLAL